MLTHGHNTEDLPASVIASIPQNLWPSLNTTDNYRGMILCYPLSKVIDCLFFYTFEEL